VDEGEIIGGLVHRTCIPTYIRRRGEVGVEEFVGRLYSWAGNAKKAGFQRNGGRHGSH
jgi:hypothetical protein